MRSFSLFLVLCIWVIGVIAADNGASSSAAPAGWNPDGFTFEVTKSPTISLFLEKINELPDMNRLFPNIEEVDMPRLALDKMPKALKANPYNKRFLFLGKKPGVPEMYLAVPVIINPDGKKKVLWSLIYAHSDQPKTLVHHGYIVTTGGDQITSKLNGAKIPDGRALETGNTLTIKELLEEELPRLRGVR
ncbi:uncharacterized protein UBRO_10022 [Ustilago bromivora]|uniref:Uncharacterized protein n=1 Tax=Ustilago bromivora TaxID=307758 RepID=A0A1K0GBW6_9BASI|nr:uncharacterized protein UBRO_10022 [Ustilago bromivora]